MSEWLIRMNIVIPPDMDEATVKDLYEREAAHCRTPAVQSHMVRLWRTPFTANNVGIWQGDISDLHAAITTFPLFPYMTSVTYEALAVNHNDPLERQRGEAPPVSGANWIARGAGDLIRVGRP